MKRFNNVWAKLVLSGTALILIYKLFNNYSEITGIFKTFFDIMFPIILGAAIAFFLSKPTEKIAALFEKSKLGFLKKKSLLISVLLLYILIFALLGIMVKFVAPKIYKNIEEFALNLPAYYKTVQSFLAENEIFSKFNSLEMLSEKIAAMLDFKQINRYIGIISGIANSFITFFLAIILSIYMIIEKKDIFGFFDKFADRFIPEKQRKFIRIYGRKTVDQFYSYFTGLALDAFIVGTVSAVFFGVLKIPYAVLLGVIVGFGNLVPFFGPIISNVAIFIIAAITAGPFKAVWVIVFQLVFGQIDGNIIQPKIISSSTGISPLLVLMAVIIFGDLFGFVGMIIGVPVCAVIKDLVVDYVDNGKLDNLE